MLLLENETFLDISTILTHINYYMLENISYLTVYLDSLF